MLNCPICGEPTKVKFTWLAADGNRRRRYVCQHGHRFTSTESIIGVTPNKPDRPVPYTAFAAKVAAS